jgi:hypothetical protein
MFSTTPLIYIVISFFSLPLLSTSSAPPRSRYLFLLGFVWISVGLLVGLKSSLRYNSMRHFLFLLPGISLLAALGMERLSGVFSSSWKKIVAPAIFLLFFMHPHYGAYLNHAVNACVNKNTHLFFDVEYFGNVYREGAFWLNNHAEENAWIYVPIFPFVANTTLLKKSSTVTIEEFKNPQQPIYLMYFTRLRRYNDVIHYAEAHLKPVYEIKRQKATLLKIFKSQAKKQAIF